MALTAEDIRTYVKDTPEFNVLLEGELQSSDALITLAKTLTISDFNGATPATFYTEETFPNDALLLYGVLYHLANGEAERQLRNNVNFNAQGLQAGIDDKQQSYSGLASFYRQMFDKKTAELKRYLNNEAAWGGVNSPYTELPTLEFRD